jgi:hypothetical protein
MAQVSRMTWLRNLVEGAEGPESFGMGCAVADGVDAVAEHEGQLDVSSRKKVQPAKNEFPILAEGW